MAKRRASRMEEIPEQPQQPQQPGEIEQLRARVADLEARPGTPAEWSVLMEAACGERDHLRRRLEQEIAFTTKLRKLLAAHGIETPS